MRLRFLFCWFVLIGAVARADGYDATLAWSERVAMSVPVSGIVESVGVDAGSRIKKDQVLLRLEATPFTAEVNAARAEVKRAKGEWQEARRELNRAKELYARETLSTVSLDRAKLGYIRADAAHESAQAKLALADYYLKHSVLRAPFDGLVLQRRAVVGQNIVLSVESPVLLVVARADRYRARAHVPGEALANASPGAEVHVETNGRRYAGTLRSVGLEPVDASQSPPLYRVEVEFVTDKEQLRAGSAAQIELP